MLTTYWLLQVSRSDQSTQPPERAGARSGCSRILLRKDGTVVPRAAWFYPDPSPGFEAIRGAVAFYPALMDECTLDGEAVVAQPGDFYGGWISSEVAGPFKGGPGTSGW